MKDMSAFHFNVAANINYMREDVAQPGWNRRAKNVPEKRAGYISAHPRWREGLMTNLTIEESHDSLVKKEISI